MKCSFHSHIYVSVWNHISQVRQQKIFTFTKASFIRMCMGNIFEFIFHKLSHQFLHCWTPHVASYHISRQTTNSFHMPPSHFVFHIHTIRGDRFPPPWCGIQFVLICPSENPSLSHVKTLAGFTFHPGLLSSPALHNARHGILVVQYANSHFHISPTHLSWYHTHFHIFSHTSDGM